MKAYKNWKNSNEFWLLNVTVFFTFNILLHRKLCSAAMQVMQRLTEKIEERSKSNVDGKNHIQTKSRLFSSAALYIVWGAVGQWKKANALKILVAAIIRDGRFSFETKCFKNWSFQRLYTVLQRITLNLFKQTKGLSKDKLQEKYSTQFMK